MTENVKNYGTLWDKFLKMIGSNVENEQRWYEKSNFSFSPALMFVDDDDEHYAAPPQIPPPKTRRWHGRPPPSARTSPVKDRWGAVAVAMAFNLEVQPDIRRPCRILLQIGQLLGWCSYKVTTSTRHDGCVRAVGRRQCCSSMVGGEGLLNAAQDESLARKSEHWPHHHINSWRAP